MGCAAGRAAALLSLVSVLSVLTAQSSATSESGVESAQFDDSHCLLNSISLHDSGTNPEKGFAPRSHGAGVRWRSPPAGERASQPQLITQFDTDYDSMRSSSPLKLASPQTAQNPLLSKVLPTFKSSNLEPHHEVYGFVAQRKQSMTPCSPFLRGAMNSSVRRRHSTSRNCATLTK